MSPQHRLLRRSAIAAAAVLVPAAPSAVAGATPATTAPTTPEASAVPEAAGDAVAGRHCTTRALTVEELRAGARSVVRCHDTFARAMAGIGVDVPADAPLAIQQQVALASGSVLAIHHDHAGGGWPSFSVAGSTCDGGGVSLSAGDPWNDRISATTHQVCTQVKHWTGPGYTGDVQLTEGSTGTLRALNGTLSNAASSMRYW